MHSPIMFQNTIAEISRKGLVTHRIRTGYTYNRLSRFSISLRVCCHLGRSLDGDVICR